MVEKELRGKTSDGSRSVRRSRSSGWGAGWKDDLHEPKELEQRRMEGRIRKQTDDTVLVVEAQNLPSKDTFSKNDPYCKASRNLESICPLLYT